MTRKLDASAWAAREEARAANRLAWASDPRNAAVSRERALVLKSQERAANRDAWSRNPVNTNREREETLAAVIPIVVPAPVDNTALGKMRKIMSDVSEPLYKRLDAAEIVLGYELAPASLVDVPADSVAIASYRFLHEVADAAETPERLRFRALKAVISIENSRAAARHSAGEQIAKRELAQQLGRDAEWAAGSWPWPPRDVAARFERAKRRLNGNG